MMDGNFITNPEVTFCIFSYNQEEYIEQACRAALAQDYSPLTIIFSDDSSKDRTFSIIEGIVSEYQGPHKIILNRNESNLGLIEHVNLINRKVETDLLVVGAGDDISKSNRVSTIVEYYKENQCAYFYSDVNKIDVDGSFMQYDTPPVIEERPDPKEYATALSLIIGATAAWTKELVERFGDISELKTYEDLIFAYRAMLLGKMCYIKAPLVAYRVGSGISTKKHIYTRLERKLKKAELEAATLNQRLKDIQTLRDADLEYQIINEVVKKNLIVRLYSQQRISINLFWQAVRMGIGPELLKVRLAFLWLNLVKILKTD
jgi:GT2 family glycosyltransferase